MPLMAIPLLLKFMLIGSHDSKRSKPNMDIYLIKIIKLINLLKIHTSRLKLWLFETKKSKKSILGLKVQILLRILIKFKMQIYI
jgi:hypothetical protein